MREGVITMTTSLLPLDNFVVINKTILNDQDRLILMLLYQPIIGSIGISLYFTLWSFLDQNKINSSGNTHSDLITIMQIKIEDIKEAREKLEGIGLIKTYLKKGDVNNYIYELYSPLSAYEFINNPILNTALYNNLSKKEYSRIIATLTVPKSDLSGYKNISRSFKDVYNFLESEKVDNKNIRKINSLELSFEPTINFNEVLSLIPEGMLNLKNISKENKEIIYQLSFIYGLDNEAMGEIIKNSIVNYRIDIDLLKDNCRSFYKFEHKGKIPKAVFQSQPLCLRQDKIEGSRKSKLINQFEKENPYDFLASKQGARPTEKDLQIIEYLIIDQKLNPGVVNVLIDYVLKINNNKLVRNFVEQIAAQWKRSKITTVSDAMNIAMNEYDKNKNKTKKNLSTKEIVPQWLTKDVKEELLTDDELLQFEKELGR